MLKLEVKKSPQVTVLRCSGRIVKGDGAAALLHAAKSEDECPVVIDLKDVTAIDAAGLGALAELERWAREEKRILQVANPSRRVRAALETTGLSSVLTICSAGGRARDAAA